MRILIAEDDLTSRRILQAPLEKWGYEVVVTCDGNEAWEALLSEDAPPLAILDWMMPGIDGPEICQRLRAKEKGQEHYTYLILLTSKGSKENIVKGMECGADDYIVKPFDREELSVRVRAGKRIIDLQTQLLAAKQELLILSRTDPLTGALNRRAILSCIESEMSRAKDQKKKFSLSILDIDFFKKVNDTYGHAAGDVVLKECVHRIESVIGESNFLGRFGGEEFLILIPEATEDKIFEVSEEIRKAIEADHINYDDSRISITVSQGIVTWNENTSVDDLIVYADEALYKAKEDGRNLVVRGGLN